ncbi:WD40-repeat-containing domain protein [Choanephora cucurbitarum]|nr:WD40-repeat-containing domain protein [Choanephora cucurbitarum]
MSIPPHQNGMDNPNRPSNNDMNQILDTYFTKKGFRQDEYALIQQQEPSSEQNMVSLEQLTDKLKHTPQTKVCLPKHIQSIQENPDQADAEAIIESYKQIREWIQGALDLYKSELNVLLYPLFIYTFLELLSKGYVEYGHVFLEKYKQNHTEHTEQINTLSTVDSIQDSSIQHFLNQKYAIRISSIPFELFFQHIKAKRFANLIRIVHQHLNIHIITGKLAPVSAGGSTTVYTKEDDMEIEIKKEKEEVEEEVLLDTTQLPTYQNTDSQTELESLAELRKRVAMASAASPSVCIYTFHHTHDQLNCIALSEDATLVAGGFSESFIKVWSLKGKKLQSTQEIEQGLEGSAFKKLVSHSGPVYGISFSHDNQYLISCSEDQTVRLWCLKTFKDVAVYKSHNYPIWDVDFGPFGFYFATASHDRTARLWSCDHMNPLRIFAGHLSDVNTVRFHPNSKYLVTGSSDRTARLWDVQRGTCVRVFTGHTGPVHTVAISPNGRLMASAGEDRSIILWDLGTGKRLKTMTGHTGFVYSISFNSDSTVLVSGGADGTVRVWDVNKDTAYDARQSDLDLKRPKYDKLNHKQHKEKKELEKARSVIDAKRKKTIESRDHLSVFPTKNTPIYTVQFTQRNLCLAAGAAHSTFDFLHDKS